MIVTMIKMTHGDEDGEDDIDDGDDDYAEDVGVVVDGGGVDGHELPIPHHEQAHLWGAPLGRT